MPAGEARDRAARRTRRRSEAGAQAPVFRERQSGSAGRRYCRKAASLRNGPRAAPSGAACGEPPGPSGPDGEPGRTPEPRLRPDARTARMRTRAPSPARIDAPESVGAGGDTGPHFRLGACRRGHRSVRAKSRTAPERSRGSDSMKVSASLDKASRLRSTRTGAAASTTPLQPRISPPISSGKKLSWARRGASSGTRSPVSPSSSSIASPPVRPK